MTQYATAQEQLAQLRGQLEDEFSALVARHEKADEANNRAYGEMDEDNPESPPYETERSGPLMQKMADLMGKIDNAGEVSDERLGELERQVSELASQAKDITLE